MRSLSLLAVGVLASSAHAGLAGNSQNYNDAFLDTFDNGLDNLDIGLVTMSDDGVNLTISVETRGFQNWTKYMIYLDTAAGGTTSNAWGRPVNLTSEIEHYIGSWVDAPSDNAQLWSWGGSWNQTGTLTNTVSGNVVSWTMSLASLGLSGGETIYFDIATSGGGSNDPGVDHLSRSDLATSGWGEASTSGDFLAYQVSGVPAPGAIALLGLAGLAGRRRR
jgi:MYXO-CTERM domain-containing protein